MRIASRQGGELRLVTEEELGSDAAQKVTAPAAAQGAIPAPSSLVGALLSEGCRRKAAVLALVSAEPRGDGLEWLGGLISPVVEKKIDYACAAYLRHRSEAAINTGIIYPLTRALYGRDLRQPLGGEAALALPLAQELLADPDWRRDPANTGSDAWLVAKVLLGKARIGQTWLGTWPHPEGSAEALSQVLARALGLVFREVERHAVAWQRAGEVVRPVATFGESGYATGDGPQLAVGRLVEAFRLGLRELKQLWGLVLSPSALLKLQHAAAGGPGACRIDDALWARIVYDFAVAHMTRVVERRQLLLSLTPLYLGWLAGFTEETHSLDDAGFDERLSQLCAAFVREKRYLIARWRWPDDFIP